MPAVRNTGVAIPTISTSRLGRATTGCSLRIIVCGGSWVAQFQLSSGLDFRVMSSSPTLGFTLGVEPT